jgi:hypothetical protein
LQGPLRQKRVRRGFLGLDNIGVLSPHLAAAALAATLALPARTRAQSAPVTGAHRSRHVFFGYAP